MAQSAGGGGRDEVRQRELGEVAFVVAGQFPGRLRPRWPRSGGRIRRVVAGAKRSWRSCSAALASARSR